MTTRATLTRLWADTFDDTVVITTPSGAARVSRLIETLPFDPSLLRLDSSPVGVDCETGRPESNHHVIVGNRHKRIIREAQGRGLRRVFVFEDDAEFLRGGQHVIAEALRWIQRHPDGWDVFYLGFMSPFLARCSYVTRTVVRAHRPFLAHALAYNRSAYADLLGIDLRGDHRPAFFRVAERLVAPGRRETLYHRDGVGSIDSWLSFSRLRRLAAHPMQVVQTAMPPGTEDGWQRRTGLRYDIYRTPRALTRIALGVHYARWAALAAAAAALTRVLRP